ncbi:MAG TPA: hypothetical protein VF384_05740 [Planctomycetota bacterium]
MRRRMAVVWMTTGLLWAACAGTGPPVTAEQLRLAEKRLLEPFMAGVEVGCGELEIDITGNFHGNVGQPGLVPEWHQVKRQRGDGYSETLWTNVSGTLAHAFVLSIGDPGELTERGIVPGKRSSFTVMNRVRLRTYEDARLLTLDVRASGPVVVVKEAAGKPREVKEFTISDGVLITQ